MPPRALIESTMVLMGAQTVAGSLPAVWNREAHVMAVWFGWMDGI
jgi:hypothetical protein